MTSITATDSMIAALRHTKGVVEVHDTNGNVIGLLARVAPELANAAASVLAPFAVGTDPTDPLADLRGDFDWDEVRRQMASKERGYTLAEVYEHLKMVTPEPEWREYLQKQIDRLREADRCGTP